MERTYSYTCDCGKRIRIREDELDKSGKCRRCGRPIDASPERLTLKETPPDRLDSIENEPIHAGEHMLAWERGDILFEHYEVGALLGEGGMGRVYRILHRDWNAELVVKAPKPEIIVDVRGALAFERECQTWVNLGLHPNIVSCYFVRRLENVPLVFAEYVRGGSLHDWIRSGRLYRGDEKRALRRILDVAIQFAWGLHYAHENGLVHQDVKPANVMLMQNRVAKVTDFGLAKAASLAGGARAVAHQDPTVTAGGMTPAYCSPEQAAGKKLTKHTDIWSWAVSVLEMFTGSVTWMAGVAAPDVLKEYARSPDTIEGAENLPAMPKPLVKLLERCFSADPADRPADLLTVARELVEIYLGTTGRFYPREEPQSKPVRGDGLHTGSLNNRAVSLVELGNVADAERRLREADDNARAYRDFEPLAAAQEIAFNRCLLQIRTNPVFAVDSVPALIPAQPDAQKQSYFVGMLMLEAGEFFSAIDYLTPVAQTPNPYQPDGLNARGIALLLVGETRPAILSFEHASRIAPGRPDVMRNLALAHYYDGKTRKALRHFEKLCANHRLDAEDQVRYATVLAAAGLHGEARVRLEEALAAPQRSPQMTLTAAELATGSQSFLPQITAIPIERVDPMLLAHEVLDNDPRNLRAHIDYATAPSRYGLRPSVTVRDRSRIAPESDDAFDVSGFAAASYLPMTKQARWGALPPGVERARCLIAASILPLIVSFFLWGRLTAEERIASTFGVANTPIRLVLWALMWTVLAFLMTRTRPRKDLWLGPLGACFGLPIAVYIPTGLHHLFLTYVRGEPTPFFGYEHLNFTLAFSGILFIAMASREAVYQRLCERVRAFGRIRNPDTGTGGAPGEQDTTVFTSFTQRTRNIAGARGEAEYPRSSNAQILVARATQSFARFVPRAIRISRELGVASGKWQWFVLPEFLLLAFADARWIAGSPGNEIALYLVLMTLGHLTLWAYTAVVPRMFLIANFAFAPVVAMLVTAQFFDDVSPGSVLLFLLFAATLWIGNLAAIDRCPAFAKPLKSYRHHYWNVQTMIDPLNIRKHAAPWQLVRFDLDQNKPTV